MILLCSSCSKPNRVPAARLHDKAKCASCKEPLLPVGSPVALASAADFDELVAGAPVCIAVTQFLNSMARPLQMRMS